MDPKELRGLMEAYSEVYAPVDEAVKGESSERRKDLAAERRAGHRPLPAKEGEKYASHKMAQMAYAKRKRMGEEVEQLDEISLKTKMSAFKKRATHDFESDSDSDNYTKSGENKTDKIKANIVKNHGEKAGAHAERAAHAGIFGRKSFSMPKKPTNEELDIFDIVLEFLQAEGYAETLEEAEWMMSNVIDEETIGIILELTGGKGHPGYKAGSRDHGPMQSGHPTDSEKRKDKGGTMSQRHGYHLGDIDDDDEDDDDLESIVKQQSRDSRERTRKPLRAKVKAARKVLSKEDYVNEADSIAAMQARREKRLQAQRKREGRPSGGGDFGHDYGKPRAQADAEREQRMRDFINKKN